MSSFLAVYRQQFDQAIVWVDEAIGIYRSIVDEQGLAYALARRGHVAFVSGDGPTAMAMLRESLDICQRIGYADGTAWPITLLAQARRWSGDESPEIKDMLEDGRVRFIAMGEIYGQAHADMILTTLYEEGDDIQASILRRDGATSANNLVPTVSSNRLVSMPLPTRCGTPVSSIGPRV